MPILSRNHFFRSLTVQTAFLIAVLSFQFSATTCFGGSPLEDTAYQETLKLYAAIPGMDQIAVKETFFLIQALNYTQLRALRAFCRLTDIRGDNARSVVERLGREAMAYETVLMLEYFSGLPKATISLSWDLLDRLRGCDFVAARALSSLVRLTPPDAAALLPLIEKVKTLSEPGQWAAKALFEIANLPYPEVGTAIHLFTPLHPRQLWAIEQFCRLNGMDGKDLIKGIRGVEALSPAESCNIRAFMRDPAMTPERALKWIDGFFALPRAEKERIFQLLTTAEKVQLLTAYDKASEEFEWEINNLHDVTDSFGGEIGEDRLREASFTELRTLFEKLHPAAQRTWTGEMTRNIAENRKSAVIAVLRKATAEARWETAADLTTANLYTLLAGGDELYTSSFRDILIPILDNRIRVLFRGDLLAFLFTTDSANTFSSQFIANLAAKGTLTRFLPASVDRQKNMLDLLALSAFRDQESLLIFSAAFPKILHPLLTPARTHLIDRMLAAIQSGDSAFSRQIQAILQYYLERQDSSLLSPADRAKIAEMVRHKGRIDFNEILQTPFRQWTEDNTLKSLSIFQQDDDGRNSFLANCRELLENGYMPSPSSSFSLGEVPQSIVSALHLLLNSNNRTRLSGLIQLFRFSAKSPIVIDWKKVLNNIEITHAVAVYQSKTHQLGLIGQFLKSDYEMFAQRGHSYWRRDQLLAPLSEVLAAGALSDEELYGKQRFFSLGSCGGIKAYLELSNIFHNRVDLLATVGTGNRAINNLYNRMLFELVATHPEMVSWEEVNARTASIFSANAGEEYLQPGSLPALLHKMIYQSATHHDPH